MTQYRQQPYVRKEPRREFSFSELSSGMARIYKTPYETPNNRRRRRFLLFRLRPFYSELVMEYPEVAPPATPVPGNGQPEAPTCKGESAAGTPAVVGSALLPSGKS